MTWTKSHVMVTKAVTATQLWKLFADVNNWHTWDKGIEYARMEGAFEQGNTFKFRPKGGPEVNIRLKEVQGPFRFVDETRFFGARMFGEHLFEPTPDGLRLTTTMTVTGPLTFLWVKLVASKIVAGLPADMQIQVETAARIQP